MKRYAIVIIVLMCFIKLAVGQKEELKFTLKGSVIDSCTQQVLHDATLKLVSSDGSINIDTTDSNGTYWFKIQPNTSYEITVSKSGYFSERKKITTVNEKESKDIELNFQLISIPIYGTPLPYIFFDLNSSVFKTNYRDSLIGLIYILKANPTLVIEVDGYKDSKESAKISEQRAQTVIDYLVEKGVESDRLVIKGFQEPNTVTYMEQAYCNNLKMKILLTEEYINSLKTEEERNKAHQLNRCVKFKILRTDYKPK